MASWKQIIGNALRRAAEDAVRTTLHSATRRAPRSTRRPAPRSHPDYPGDFVGRPQLSYAPREDGQPDPGEVVWTWVPYEEDHSRGKDRPVLLVGYDGPWLLGLQMTSQDHDRDAAQEAREGRYWMDIGTGGWDHRGRASEVRLNRLIRIDPDGVRRTAARLDERRFAEVARGIAEHY